MNHLKHPNHIFLNVIKRNTFKCFSYFRTGYALYLGMAVGLINLLTASYFLAIQKIPFALDLFPNFYIYAATIIVIGVPFVGVIGWLHYKRIGTYSAGEMVMSQADPFNYKYKPGYALNVIGPALVQILNINHKRILGEKLSTNDIIEIERLEQQLEKLAAGGYVGNPPKGVFK